MQIKPIFDFGEDESTLINHQIQNLSLACCVRNIVVLVVGGFPRDPSEGKGSTLEARGTVVNRMNWDELNPKSS